MLTQVALLPNLTSLHCHSSALRSIAGLPALASRLQVLRVDGADLEYVADMRAFSNLQALCFSSSLAISDDEAPIESDKSSSVMLSKLRSLTFNIEERYGGESPKYSALTAGCAIVSRLLSLPSLTSVHLDEGWTLNDLTMLLLEHTAGIPTSSVQHLRIGTRFRTVRAAAHLSLQLLSEGFPRLQSLELFMNATFETLIDAAMFQHLHALTLVGMPGLMQEASCLQMLGQHPTLQTLTLHCLQRGDRFGSITEEMLPPLAASRSWHTLTLVGVGGEAALHQSIAQIPQHVATQPELKRRLEQSRFRFVF